MFTLKQLANIQAAVGTSAVTVANSREAAELWDAIARAIVIKQHEEATAAAKPVSVDDQA